MLRNMPGHLLHGKQLHFVGDKMECPVGPLHTFFSWEIFFVRVMVLAI